MEAVILALKALPALIKLLVDLGRFLKETLGDNPGKYIVDVHEAFTGLRNAKTPEEKQAAARSISQLISRL